MKDKIVVVLSCILMVALGSVYIAQHWIGQGEAARGMKLAVFYSAVIIVAHIAAYRQRGRQPMADSIPPACAAMSDAVGESPRGVLDYAPCEQGQPKHRMRLSVILVQQVGLLVVSSMVLDGGGCFGFGSVLVLVFWGIAGAIWCFKSSPMSRVEAFLLNYGFVLLIGAILMLLVCEQAVMRVLQ